MFRVLKNLYKDAKNIKDKDPATSNILEVLILYPGFLLELKYTLVLK